MSIHRLQVTLGHSFVTRFNVKIIMDFGLHVRVIQSLLEKPLGCEAENIQHFGFRSQPECRMEFTKTLASNHHCAVPAFIKRSARADLRDSKVSSSQPQPSNSISWALLWEGILRCNFRSCLWTHSHQENKLQQFRYLVICSIKMSGIWIPMLCSIKKSKREELAFIARIVFLAISVSHVSLFQLSQVSQPRV